MSSDQQRASAAEVSPSDAATLVSVVIPAYNAARFLATAISSVLGQTWTDLECIVVDDGSTDATAAVAQAFDDPRVRYVHKQNGGVSDARNTGIGQARGSLIALLDADDAWLPDKLARQVAVLAERPDVVLVHCAYAITDEDLGVLVVIGPDPRPDHLRRWFLLEGNGIAPASTALLRRAAVDAAGGFRLELSVSADVEFVDRIAQQGAVEAVDACLVLYRTHTGQIHTDLRTLQHDVEWFLADRFGPDGQDERAPWRRGTTNLHVRLFAYALRSGDLRRAGGHFATALRLEPLRLVALPFEAVVRRVRRHARGRAHWPDAAAIARLGDRRS